MSPIRLSRRRRGLTLIELVVVLMILIALAGAIVPILLNFRTRAHGAAGTDQLVEANKWIVYYEVESGSLPDDLDSLMEDDASDISTTPYDGLETSTGGSVLVTSGGNLDAIAVSSEFLDALNNAGINRLRTHPDDPEHATKDANTGALVTLTDSHSLLGIDGTGVIAAAVNGQVADLGLPADGVFVVLGFGPDSTIVTTKTILSAPVHFGEEDTPEENYKRLVLVIQVGKLDDAGTGIDALEKARFVGAFAIHEDGALEGIDGHVFEYHEAAGTPE